MAGTAPARGALRDLWPNLRLTLGIAWDVAPIEFVGQAVTYVLGALTPIAMSLTLRAIIDALDVAAAAEGTVGVLPAAVVTVLVARAAIRASNDLVFWILGASFLERRFWFKMQNALVLRFSGKVSALDLGHLEDAQTQNTIVKARDNLNWRVLNTTDGLVRTVNSAATFAGAFIVLLPFGWWIPALLGVSALPRLLLRARYSSLQWGVYDAQTPTTRKLWYLRWLLTDVEPIREARIFGGGPVFLGRVRALQDEVTREQLRVADRAALAYVLPVLVEAAVLLGITLWALPDVLLGVTSIGTFTLLLTLSEQMGGAVAGVLMNATGILENSLYLTDIRRILTLPALLPQPVHPIRLPDAGRPPRIEFSDVRFAYPSGSEVLQGVSFAIEPGQRVALVGANGAGKTTIVKLLCRFYDVTSGAIRVGGVDLRDVALTDWYRHLGTLFQEFQRYKFTVREVIALGGDGDVSDARVLRAARMSGAAEYIERFPKGYDTPLGREYDGEELSAGQWQKLAIARAFYRAAPVLILDEPTSAIDAIAEEEIFRNLARTYVDKTLLLISHRFSTVREADLILVLEDGRIAERGNHDELLSLNGTYARMFRAQAKGYQ